MLIAVKKAAESIGRLSDGVKEAKSANAGRPDRYVCAVDKDERRLAEEMKQRELVLERLKSSLDAFDTPRRLFYQAYYCDDQKGSYAARIARISKRTASRYIREVGEASKNAVDGD